MLDWNQYREQLLKTIGDLGRLSPQTVRGYRELSDAGTKTARLTAKTRELIALAVECHTPMRRLHHDTCACGAQARSDGRSDRRSVGRGVCGQRWGSSRLLGSCDGRLCSRSTGNECPARPFPLEDDYGNQRFSRFFERIIRCCLADAHRFSGSSAALTRRSTRKPSRRGAFARFRRTTIRALHRCCIRRSRPVSRPWWLRHTRGSPHSVQGRTARLRIS